MTHRILPGCCLTIIAVTVMTGTSDAGVLGWIFGQRRSNATQAARPESAVADDANADAAPRPTLRWNDDYASAYDDAERAEKLLLVNFVPDGASRDQANLEAAIAAREVWRTKLQDFVLCKVAADAEIQVQGKPVRLLSHAAFAEMHNRPGIAVIDLANEGAPYYGRVVSAFPFMNSKYYRWQTGHFAAVLELPPGTITQRSMIWAVRTHPERPASTNGAQDANLANAAASHSSHQASIGVQGHHNWEGRFHRLRRLLGGGAPVEVVAESWPDQTMIDSCVDCVRSWRYSSGHWSAVRSQQSRYGYDIRRGRNGIWYGTGIFLR